MKPVTLALLNAWFYGLLVLFSLVAIPALALAVACQALFLSHRQAMRRFRRAISWYGFAVIYVLPFPWIRMRHEKEGADSAPGPFIFVCNHRSSCDPFLMGCLPEECVQIVNTWPMHLPVWGPMARLAGYLSINEMPVEEFFARARRLLAEGTSIVAFPEGTRSRSRDMGPFHSSVFRLALQEKVAIVPLCISGSERTPPKGSLVLHPGVVRVRRLPAWRWEEYRDLTPFQLKNQVRDRIASALISMENTA